MQWSKQNPGMHSLSQESDFHLSGDLWAEQSHRTLPEREERKGPEAGGTDEVHFLHLFCIEQAITVSKVS